MTGTVQAFGGVRPSGVPARFRHLLCPLLTSAPRSGTLAGPSVPTDTMQISRGKLDRLHRTPAESTDLGLRWIRDFADPGPLVRPRLPLYSVPVRQVAALLPRFLQTAPRGHRPCASLALCLHQTWAEDLHLQAVKHARHTRRPGKRSSRRRDQTDASGPAFSTPPWTARAPPTGTTGILTLVTNKATRIGSTRRRHTELTRN